MDNFVKENLLLKFIFWYYLERPKRILVLWGNFLRFGWNYFSIGLLLKTLFNHWHRYQWFYARGFDPKQWSQTLAFNLISRVLGMIARTVLIIIGLVFLAVIILSGLFIFLLWLILPFLIALFFYFGYRLTVDLPYYIS
jgi:hypothetical protein